MPRYVLLVDSLPLTPTHRVAKYRLREQAEALRLQAVDLAHWMLRHEGLLLGSSSAMNLVGACLVARQQQDPSQTTTTQKTTTRICTVICDTGQRHLTRFWNRDFIVGRGLEWPGDQPSRRQDQLPAILG